MSCASDKLKTNAAGVKDIDPVIEHLLQNARSDAVREEFLLQPQDDYTQTHTLRMLVSLP